MVCEKAWGARSLTHRDSATPGTFPLPTTPQTPVTARMRRRIDYPWDREEKEFKPMKRINFRQKNFV